MRLAGGWLCLVVTASLSGVACDYDIPALSGGGGATGGGGSGGGGCQFTGCPMCEAPRICDPVAGCVLCVEDSDCTDGDSPICDNHRCVQCTADDLTQCNGDAVCNQGECRQRCQNETDCDPQQDCVLDRCIQCLDDSNCFDGEVCDADAGVCLQCLDDGDCASAFPEGNAPRCSPEGNCVACLVSEDCPQPGQCLQDLTCQPTCCSNEDCVLDSEAPTCDVSTNLCIPCTVNTDCLRGQCDTGAGRCFECETDADCTPDLPACGNQICKQCDANHPCEDPNVCFEDKCLAPLP